MFNAVSCASSSDCWAVGYFCSPGCGEDLPLAAHWDGSGWSLAEPPAAQGTSVDNLVGITCATSSDCWAVGFSYGSGEAPLVEHWDGTSWSLVSAASAGTGDASLSAVTCVATSECWAAGSWTPSSGGNQALIERWDGTAWSVNNAATPTLASSERLGGVACASADLCWAVGEYTLEGTTLEGSGVPQALIERWDGTSWIVDDPADASPLTQATLSAVACTVGGACYASGAQMPTGGSAEPLVDSESGGGSWASDSAPSPSGATSAGLSGIACASASCWTVGSQVTAAGDDVGLVESNAGSVWSIGTAEDPLGTQANQLNGVSCVSNTTCYAVGWHGSDTLVESWDGSGWSIVPSPSVPGEGNTLQSISCVSSADCWAVGFASGVTGVPVYFGNVSPTELPTATTLIESWNGSVWTIVSSPNPTGAQMSLLSGVACASADDCWAVGNYYQAADSGACLGLNCVPPVAISQTLIEHWNGTSWAVTSSADTSPAEGNTLLGVTCVSSSDCWAVGNAEGTQTTSGLVEQWNGSAWGVVNSPQTSGNQSAGLFGVSCADAAHCWGVGYSFMPSGKGPDEFENWVEGWNGSSWSVVASPNVDAEPWGPVDGLFGVACASVNDCSAVGQYFNGPVYDTLALHWDGSAWTVVGSQNPIDAQQLAALLCEPNCGAFLYGVTCIAGGSCVSVGTFNDTTGTLRTLVETNNAVPPQQVPESGWVALLVLAALPAAVLIWRRPRSAQD